MTTKRKPTPGVNRAAGYGDASDSANHTPIGVILAEHFCCCRPGSTCILCVTWNRLIRRIESREVAL